MELSRRDVLKGLLAAPLAQLAVPAAAPAAAALPVVPVVPVPPVAPVPPAAAPVSFLESLGTPNPAFQQWIATSVSRRQAGHTATQMQLDQRDRLLREAALFGLGRRCSEPPAPSAALPELSNVLEQLYHDARFVYVTSVLDTLMTVKNVLNAYLDRAWSVENAGVHPHPHGKHWTRPNYVGTSVRDEADRACKAELERLPQDPDRYCLTATVFPLWSGGAIHCDEKQVYWRLNVALNQLLEGFVDNRPKLVYSGSQCDLPSHRRWVRDVPVVERLTLRRPDALSTLPLTLCVQLSQGVWVVDVEPPRIAEELAGCDAAADAEPRVRVDADFARRAGWSDAER